MQQQFTGFEPRMLLKGSGEMRNGGIAQHDGDLGDAQPFFVQQVAGVLHTLALVEIENGRPKHFLKSFFKVAFIDGYFPAEFLDGKGFTDMLQQHFPGFDDFFPVGFIRQEFALEAFYLFFSQHAFQAVKEEHLALGIDKNILQAIRIGMVE